MATFTAPELNHLEQIVGAGLKFGRGAGVMRQGRTGDEQRTLGRQDAGEKGSTGPEALP